MITYLLMPFHTSSDIREIVLPDDFLFILGNNHFNTNIYFDGFTGGSSYLTESDGLKIVSNELRISNFDIPEN